MNFFDKARYCLNFDCDCSECEHKNNKQACKNFVNTLIALRHPEWITDSSGYGYGEITMPYYNSSLKTLTASDLIDTDFK